MLPLLFLIVLPQLTSCGIISGLLPSKKNNCGLNEVYRVYGHKCPLSCDTLREKVCCNEVTYVPGCFCVDGFILETRDGPRKCVPIFECPRPGILRFKTGSISFPEKVGVARIPVIRVNGSKGEVTVRWKADNLDPGLLTFPDGVNLQYIEIPIEDNQVWNPDVTFQVKLFDPSNKAELSPEYDHIQVTIVDDDMKPGYLEMEKTDITIEESQGKVKVNVVRLGGKNGQITIRFKTVPGTARERSDFIPTSGKLVFEEGETVKPIYVSIVDDGVREGPETFRVQLFDPQAAPGVRNFKPRGTKLTTTVLIKDDDMNPGYLELETGSLSVPESAGKLRIKVVRQEGTDGQLRVKYKAVGSTANSNSDYAPTEGELVFEEGETSKFIDVPIIDDDLREKPESFRLELFDPSTGADVINFRDRGSIRSVDITIIDNDMKPGTLEFEKATFTTPEGSGSVTVCVIRVDGTDGEIQVRFKTVSRTALAKQDFKPRAGLLVFREGDSRKCIVIQLVNDDVREPKEIFEIALENPTAAPDVINFRGLGGRRATTVTITDDDMQPGALELEQSAYTVSENVGTVKIGVVRTGGSDGIIRVLYKTGPKTAQADQDFKPTSGELVFKEGEKVKYFSVQIANDKAREPTETFDVELYDSSAAPDVINFRGLGGRRLATISITDDDMNPGYLELETGRLSVPESAGNVRIKVVRQEGTDGQLRVKYKAVGSTASSNSDYAPTEGELVFEEGETSKFIDVPIIDDDLREKPESFRLELFDPSTGADVINFRDRGSIRSVDITIIDNDMKPGFLELDRPIFAVPENVGTVQVGVVRVDGTEGEIRVHYKTVPKSAHAGQDFAPTSGQLVFREGETVKYITVKITDDDVWEPAESFDVVLYDTTAGPGVINFRGLGPKTTTTITVTDDDMRPGYLEMQQTSLFVPEDVGRVKICVVRLDGSDGDIRVLYKTVPLSATEEEDFQPSRGSLLFKVKETKKCFYVRIVNDNVREPTEVFEVVLTESSAGPGVSNFKGLRERTKLTISITDDDMTPGELQLGETTYVTRENDGRVRIKVVRTGGSDGQVQVRYKTIGKTAQAKVDFIDISGTLVFSLGETIKYIEVPIIDDRTREPTESFEVLLFDPTPGEGVINFNGLGEKVTATVTIIDDDMSPGYFELEKPTYSVRENDGTLKIGVVRLDGSDGQVRVHYKTTPLTALDGVDFNPTSGELVFEEGEKLKYFDVNIRNDDVWEPTKNFKVELFDSLAGPNVINFRGIGQRKFSTITIDDDDMKPGFLELGRPTYSIPESAGTVRVEVVRVDGSDGEVRVRLKTVSRSATAGLDFQSVDIELVFKDRETRKFVQIPIVDDDVREPSESFQVQLYDPSSSPGTINFRGLGPRSVSSITIDDNDVHPGVLDFEQTNIAVPEDIGVVRVTIIRTGGGDGKLVARYRTKDGTARRGTDYTPVEGEVEFQEGEIRRTLTINIVDDNTKEPLENFEIQIFTDDPRARRSTTITVIDNDVNPGTFEFRERALSVVESERQVVLTVQRTGGSDGLSTVTWRTIDGTAIEGFDYRGRRGSLTFNDGETEKTITIDVIDDQIRERDEQFMVGLFDPSRGVIGLNSMVTVTIRDDDEGVPSNPVVSSNIEVFFTELIVRVGKGVNTARFHIERTGDLRPITVFLQTLDGSAKGGDDYRKTKGRIRFDRNEIKLTVEIKLVERRKQEFGKYFLVKLSNPSEGLVVPTHDTLTVIIDEEALRMNESPEVKTISEADFDFDFSGRSGGSFTQTSSSSSSETSVSETSGTSSRCNKCRPGTKGDNLPNPNIPSNRVPNIKTTGTSLDLSGIRTSNVNTGSPGVGGTKTISTSMNFSVTGMKIPGFNTDLGRNPTINNSGVSNLPNVKIPTSRGDVSRGSNMRVHNSRVEITRKSSSHTSGTNMGLPGIGIPGTVQNLRSSVGIPNLPGVPNPASNLGLPNLPGVNNPGSNFGLPNLPGVNNPGINFGLPNLPGVQNPATNLGLPNLPGVQNPASNLGLPNLPGVQNPGGNLGLPNTGLGRPSGNSNRGSNGRVDMTSSMSGNFQVPPAQLPPQSQDFGFTKTINCPPGMTFRRCAPTCPLSCGTLNRSTCQKKCINACFCPEGTVIDNPKSHAPRCVHPSTCRGSKMVAPPPGNTGVGGLLGGLGGLTGILG